MILLENVSKTYANKTVLSETNLRFASDQTHVLLGSSGSGKSTILNLIMGLVTPTTGTIHIDDQIMQPSTQRSLVRKIGYVIQDGGLFPHLTVYDNVALVGETAGWGKSQIKQRITELCKLVELESKLLHSYPDRISGGERQRAGLMRALMLDPKIILLDEPLSALDPIVRSHLQQQLKHIFNLLRKTVIIVTHDIGEAAFFGHTITLLSQGHIIQHGQFIDLVKAPATAFVTEFLNAQKPPEELRLLL